MYPNCCSGYVGVYFCQYLKRVKFIISELNFNKLILKAYKIISNFKLKVLG